MYYVCNDIISIEWKLMYSFLYLLYILKSHGHNEIWLPIKIYNKISQTKRWNYWCVTFLWISFTFETSSSLWVQNRKIERLSFPPPSLCCSSCPGLLNCDQIAGSLLLTAVTRKFLTSTCLGSQSLGILKSEDTGRPRIYINQ